MCGFPDIRVVITDFSRNDINKNVVDNLHLINKLVIFMPDKL